ncbi:hypothetical protein [Methylobacterium sp. V23]|uniref:hypothetical protein n=1 Tax=Methylobacterium sp. V23 TaxID=2044878 RepID=UPI000CDAA67E|nr:hypothetical protein [Methylobacterium sp. V23]POR42187.1 hypothetical protein CRT23_15040 [Methylobacterium sp. V23]
MSFPAVGDARTGQGSLGISEDQIVMLVKLLVQAARRTRRLLATLPGTFDENTISIQVHQELQVVQERLQLEGFEFFQEGILNRPGRRPLKIQGRIDFMVKFDGQLGKYKRYFGIECKRVAAKRWGLSRYYIRSGVGKYAAGVYSEGHSCAMLVGYVLTPPSDAVIADLERRILRDHQGASALREVPWATGFRDARVYEGELPRAGGTSLRLLHAMVRMHA